MVNGLRDLPDEGLTIDQLEQCLREMRRDEEMLGWSSKQWEALIEVTCQKLDSGIPLTEYEIFLYELASRWLVRGFQPGIPNAIIEDILDDVVDIFIDKRQRRGEITFSEVKECVERIKENEMRFWRRADWEDFFQYICDVTNGKIKETGVSYYENVYRRILFEIGKRFCDAKYPSSKSKKEQIIQGFLDWLEAEVFNAELWV